MIVTEIDPICALQAAMEGYQVATIEDTLDFADIYITTTGNFNIITADHMAKMKDKAIVGNIGHFDNEIEMTELEGMTTKTNIKPQYDMYTFEDGHSVLVLAEGSRYASAPTTLSVSTASWPWKCTPGRASLTPMGRSDT